MNENNEWARHIAGERFAYLTTFGRRTGNPHRIEIWFAVHDGRIYLMSGGRDASDWVKNLQANPRVQLEIADEVFQGIATILPEPSEQDQLARTLLVQKYQKTDELKAWGENSLAIVIDLD